MNHNRFFPNGQIKAEQPDLFNFAYADGGNGDEASGDGFVYRGRGIIQITKRDKYKGFTVAHNIKNPNDIKDFENNESHREEIITNIDYAVESACWYWRTKGALSSKFNAQGDINIIVDNAPNDVNLVSQAVNVGQYGQSNGLEERIEYFNKLKKYLQEKGNL